MSKLESDKRMTCEGYGAHHAGSAMQSYKFTRRSYLVAIPKDGPPPGAPFVDEVLYFFVPECEWKKGDVVAFKIKAAT